jgi:ADP-heptose:LPS heptosyltransferase
VNILIVKTSSMGDVIHTLPAAIAIRAANPNAHIGWAVEAAHADILAGQSWLDETIVWKRGSWKDFADFVYRLRRTRWNVVIDFQGLLRSGLIAWLSGARSRIGYAPTREKAHWFYNERAPLETLDRHAVERYLQLASHLGANTDGLAIDRPYLGRSVEDLPVQNPIVPPVASRQVSGLFPLHPSHADRQAVAAWQAEAGFDARYDRLVLLNPHCRKDANRWPAERFAELASRLIDLPRVRQAAARLAGMEPEREERVVVALTGGKAAGGLCEQIREAVPERQRDLVWRADGKLGLLASAALIAQSDVLVTGDTGPMHIAAAVGTPIVAIFGPANPLRTGPYASDAVVLREPLECSPCFANARCPLGHVVPKCLDLIGVERVVQGVRWQLSRQADRRRQETPRRKSA